MDDRATACICAALAVMKCMDAFGAVVSVDNIPFDFLSNARTTKFPICIPLPAQRLLDLVSIVNDHQSKSSGPSGDKEQLQCVLQALQPLLRQLKKNGKKF